MLDLSPGDPQLRHIDRAWVSTVHAFQGRTVDTVIAAMEANHPKLANQKTLCVEISRARPRRTRDRRPGGAPGTARSDDGRAHRGARGGRAGARERPRGRAGWGSERGSRRPPGGIAGAGTDAGAQPDRSGHDAVASMTARIRRSCEPPMRRAPRGDQYESPGLHAGLADPIPRK